MRIRARIPGALRLPLVGWLATSVACGSPMQPDGGADASRDVQLPAPGEAGAPCSANGECASNVCTATGVCTASCASAADCPSGWTCASDAGASYCACVLSSETCDGADNDCNGIVDDGLTGCPCPLSSETRCGAVCTVLSSDRANCGACGRACAGTETCSDGRCAPAKLDLLFAIDSSSGMSFGQVRLFARLGELIQSLTQGASGAVPVASLHVGVVSADLGTGGFSIPGCQENSIGDDGLLNPIRYGPATAHNEPWTYEPASYPRPADCTDPAQFPPFLAWESATGDPAQFDHDLRCNVAIGAGRGCGLESQLESMYRALVIHDARDTPGNTSPNAGFVRSDAALAILMLTDEEDGSVRDCRFANASPCEGEGAVDVYNPSSEAWADREINLRLYLDQPCSAQDPTWSLDRYIDTTSPARGLFALKPGHPERIVFAAITGVPLGTAPVGAGGTLRFDWDALLGTPSSRGPDDFCGRDSSALGALSSAEGPVSMQQANRDSICIQRVVPACRAEGTPFNATACTPDVQYFAWPARRIVEIARRFDQAPLCTGHACHSGMVASVCANEYGAAISRFAALIQSRL